MPIDDGDRMRLAATFDAAAALYGRARPDYPPALFDTLAAAADLTPGDALLEVGCGTGKATLPLAQRGFHLLCVEPGPALAAAARVNLKDFPVQVVETRFEEWKCPDTFRFRLVFSATAWHWVDPAKRYQLAWEALAPSGHLAFWSAGHVFPDGGDSFFREIQDVYEEIGEDRPLGGWPKPGELPDSQDEILATGLFEPVLTKHFSWTVRYTADQYVELLETFSSHIAMEDEKRRKLYRAMRHLISQRADPRVSRGWGAVLNVARRLG